MSIPNREELLIEANKKLNSKSDTVKHLLHHMSIEDYVLLLFNKCTPSQYGTLFENRLKKELEKYTLVSHIDKRHESGDIMIKYPFYTSIGEKYELSTFEIKFTYVNSKGSFNIKNIRLYNNFDFLILCVCNPHSNFSLKYYCIKKENLQDIGLSLMNGTKRSNKNNEKVCYGTTITINGLKEFKLDNNNILKGNDINDLLRFMSDKQIELVENYTDRYNKRGKKYILPYGVKKFYSYNEELYKTKETYHQEGLG